MSGIYKTFADDNADNNKLLQIELQRLQHKVDKIDEIERKVEEIHGWKRGLEEENTFNYGQQSASQNVAGPREENGNNRQLPPALTTDVLRVLDRGPSTSSSAALRDSAIVSRLESNRLFEQKRQRCVIIYGVPTNPLTGKEGFDRLKLDACKKIHEVLDIEVTINQVEHVHRIDQIKVKEGDPQPVRMRLRMKDKADEILLAREENHEARPFIKFDTTIEMRQERDRTRNRAADLNANPPPEILQTAKNAQFYAVGDMGRVNVIICKDVDTNQKIP